MPPTIVMLLALTLLAPSTAPGRSAAGSTPVNAALERELVAKHGRGQEARIRRGIAQVAALWRETDGDMAAFVREQFIAEPARLDSTLARYEAIFEQIDGHFLEVNRALRGPTDLDIGPLLPVDPLLAAFDPSAHLTEDLFQSKLAFVALLNFPQSTLEDRMRQGGNRLPSLCGASEYGPALGQQQVLVQPPTACEDFEHEIAN